MNLSANHLAECQGQLDELRKLLDGEREAILAGRAEDLEAIAHRKSGALKALASRLMSCARQSASAGTGDAGAVRTALDMLRECFALNRDNGLVLNQLSGRMQARLAAIAGDASGPGYGRNGAVTSYGQSQRFRTRA